MGGLFLLPALLCNLLTEHGRRRSFRFQRWRFTSAKSFLADAGPATSQAQHVVWQPDSSQGLSRGVAA